MAAAETVTEVRATAKWVRTAPRKAQLVVAEIRGRSVDEARTILAFMPRAAARDVESVLKSAVANAEANHGLSGDELYVSAAEVGCGPTLKRWRARARGRVGRIKKRTCHITIRLAPVEGAVAVPPAPALEEPAPRRARRPKAAASPEAAPAAQPAAEAPAPASEAPAEEAPSAPVKPARARRPKAQAGDEGAAPPEAAAPEAAAPAPRRARAKQAAEAPPAEAAEAPPAEKPKRAPRRKASEEPKEGER
jgi:large subunit ribosomal protein L22